MIWNFNQPPLMYGGVRNTGTEPLRDLVCQVTRREVERANGFAVRVREVPIDAGVAGPGEGTNLINPGETGSVGIEAYQHELNTLQVFQNHKGGVREAIPFTQRIDTSPPRIEMVPPGAPPPGPSRFPDL